MGDYFTRIGKNILNHDLIVRKGNVSGSSISLGSFGSVYAATHITASGNISASGTIYADNFQSVGGDSAGISFTDDFILTGNMTASGDISGSSTSTGSFGRLSTSTLDLSSIQGNWTNAGNTVADGGTFTTIDINGGTVDGATIGAASHTTIKGTTIDATTDFTIDGLVLTADTITNDATLTMDLADDMVIDVDGGNLDVKDDGAVLLNISATDISGSSLSTGSFATLRAVDPAGININAIGTVSSSITSTGSFGRLESTTINGTNIDAATDFTVGGTVITDANIDDDGTLTIDGATGLNLQEGGTDVIAIDTNQDVLFSRTGGSTSDPDVEFDGYIRFDGITEVANTTTSTTSGTGALLVDGGIGVAENVNVGGNLTVTGNYTVNGTTTFISSSTLEIGDNIIQVNSVSPVRYGGIQVKDLNATETGSMVWDSSNDYWLAGQSGSEYRVPIQNTTTALSDNKVIIAQGNGRIESGDMTDNGVNISITLPFTSSADVSSSAASTGSFGRLTANGNIHGTDLVVTNLYGTIGTAAQNSITSATSLASVGTITTGVWNSTFGGTSNPIISGSFTAASSSFSSRITSDSSSLSTRITADSSSFSTRITDATASIDALTTASGSLSTRVTNNETTASSLISNYSTVQSLGTSDNVQFNHITASGNISASGTIYADNFTSTGQDVGGISFADDLNITGDITASGHISSSYSSTGSFGRLTAAGNIHGTSLVGTNLYGTIGTAAQNSITSATSLASVGTVTTGVWNSTFGSTSNTLISGSFSKEHLGSKVANVVTSSAQIAADISGSLGSNASLIRTLTAVGISGSFTDASSSLAGRITAVSGAIDIATGSYIGTTNVTTLGTITTGVWNGTAIDIGDNTNLVGGTNITLSGDTLNVDDAFLINDGNDTTSGTITAGGFTTTATASIGRAEISGDLTVAGNYTVNGTTTFISSSTLEIGDNIIQVNSVSPVKYGGIHVKDTTATQTGSLVWDSSNDYWLAGQSGSEYRVPIQNTTTALTDNKV